MKFTLFISAATLAYTAGSVPIKQTPENADKIGNARPSNAELGPVPVAVTPNGLLVPAAGLQPSSLAGGMLEDFPSVNDLGSQVEAKPKQLHSRAAMWKPVEINNYHEGVKIDLKNSIIELKDKLDYLNIGGRLTVDQASRQIDHLAKVIATRIRINFVTNPPRFYDMISALQKHIVSEIQTRQKNPRSDPPLSLTQQAEQDILFANLHAHYIFVGLKEKIVLLARTRKLNNRLGRLSIDQARQIINNTPSMSQNDLESCEKELTQIEKAMGAMIKKKLVDFPASAVFGVGNPIKSDFKLPGEDVPSVETLVESRSDSQGESTEEASSNADSSAPDVDTSIENPADNTKEAADSSQLSRRSVPVEKRQVYRTKEEAFLHSDHRKLTTEDKVAFLHWSQASKSELSNPRYSSAGYNNRINNVFRERQRQRFAGSQTRLHGRDLPEAPYQNITQSATDSTSAYLPAVSHDAEAIDQAISLIGRFQNELRYLERTGAPWDELIQLVHETAKQLSGIEGVLPELVLASDEYFRDISQDIAPSSKDLNETMTKIESRSTPVSRPTAFRDNFLEILPWGTLNKRDTDVVNITTTPTVSTGEEEADEPFWIDFGAPECMKFILDEDLDQAKLTMFVTCEENAAAETPETQDSPEATEGMIEERDITKHIYEIEEDGEEWGRKMLVTDSEGIEHS
ncbi:hypothetical protein IFR05_013034 [Cadophora sp. M221]|nr:hypothetical protein IFR05_013034 [Cadophora sp. M221]